MLLIGYLAVTMTWYTLRSSQSAIALRPSMDCDRRGRGHGARSCLALPASVRPCVRRSVVCSVHVFCVGARRMAPSPTAKRCTPGRHSPPLVPSYWNQSLANNQCSHPAVLLPHARWRDWPLEALVHAIARLLNKKPSCRQDSRLVVSDLQGHPSSMIFISPERACATSY